MTEPKVGQRYHFQPGPSYRYYMAVQDDGSWVRYSDYARLAGELEEEIENSARVERGAQQIRERVGWLERRERDLEDERDGLAEELGRIRRGNEQAFDIGHKIVEERNALRQRVEELETVESTVANSYQEWLDAKATNTRPREHILGIGAAAQRWKMRAGEVNDRLRAREAIQHIINLVDQALGGDDERPES